MKCNGSGLEVMRNENEQDGSEDRQDRNHWAQKNRHLIVTALMLWYSGLLVCLHYFSKYFKGVRVGFKDICCYILHKFLCFIFRTEQESLVKFGT